MYCSNARLTAHNYDVIRNGKRDFDKGDRVMTHLGPGTVVYKRMAPPSFSEVEVYSVCLDSKKEASEKPPFPTYTGTIVKAEDVRAEE